MVNGLVVYTPLPNPPEVDPLPLLLEPGML